MFFNHLKTVLFLGFLTGLLLFIGNSFGGTTGLHFALIFSIGMNLFSYFYADKMVLKMYRAQPLSQTTHGNIHEIVEDLCIQAKIPKPKLWLIPSNIGNAFATGRNPANASVAVTQGIIQMLDEGELRAVLAHELSHVKNRDILVTTIAATIAASIGYLASMLRWSLIFGGGRRNNRGGGAGALVAVIIVPIAATLIQLAISRTREFMADEKGAHICQDPLALASALRKIERGPKMETTSQAHMATESMFFANPFKGKSMMSWLATHPSTDERVARLEKMAQKYHH